MGYQHKELASGRWHQFSLAEQLANIGSEVHRAINWHRKKDEKYFRNAFERALELFDLTLEDQRWKGRRKELARSREAFCTLLLDGENIPNLDFELDSLDRYFTQFAFAARLSR